MRTMRRMSSLLGSLSRLDRNWMRRSGRLPDSVADTALRGLTRAADHSFLWFGIAALLVARKGSTRRAGLRGVGAIAATSVLTNASAKWVIPRRRPATSRVPVHRRLVKRPDSSSFPSGHAASAAAFATSVTMENSAAGALIAPAAAAVAYSRVHTGTHWPSDVAAGLALGTGVGIATKRWWPVRPAEAAQTRHSARVAALREGEGLIMAVNPSSGNADQDPTEDMRATWPAAELIHPDPDMDLGDQLSRTIRERAEHAKAVGVAGGDGTVAAAAAAAAEHGLPLAVVPTGTLNHFGRDVGVVTADDVSRALAAGSAVQVGMGSVVVDDRSSAAFVNTASIGGYPEMVRLREQWEHRWGKWPAAAAALVRVLSQARPIRVRLDGRIKQVWMLFAGNSGYRPKGFAPTWRPQLDDGVLDVRYVRADLRFSRTRFVFAALSGALSNSRTYVQREHKQVDVEVLGEPVAFACDGEVRAKGNRFFFAARDNALKVYRPEELN